MERGLVVRWVWRAFWAFGPAGSDAWEVPASHGGSWAGEPGLRSHLSGAADQARDPAGRRTSARRRGAAWRGGIGRAQ